MIDVTETDEVLGQGAYCVTVKVKYGHTVCAAKRLYDILLTSWDKVSVYYIVSVFIKVLQVLNA